MDWHDRHEVVEMAANTSSDSGSRNYAATAAAPGERAVTRSAQALLVFANPATIDCERRKWPLSFQRLFSTGRLSGFATPETDVHIFTAVAPLASKRSPYTVHLQDYTGASFGERLENAVEHLAGLGYCKIVIVGSDCPNLTASDISNAFQLLDQKRLVLGPDHRGGCYLIGLHREDRAQLSGIRWHQNTDCAELLQRFGKNATAQLAVKLDLDTLEDLRLLAGSGSFWSPVAVVLLQSLDYIHPDSEESPHRSATERQTLSWQLPPPFLPVS